MQNVQNMVHQLLGELNKKYPQWDVEVSEYLETDTDTPNEPYKHLTDILKQIILQIRDKKLVRDDLTQIFSEYKQYKCYDYIVTFVWNRINLYSDYSLLRETHETDKYMAQKIIDIIWDEIIFRFNPYLDWEERLKIDNDSTYRNLAKRLDIYVTKCVRFSLTYDAMVKTLENESEMPEELCRYVAKKVEENMRDLKINYILDRLVRLDQNVDVVLEKAAKTE